METLKRIKNSSLLMPGPTLASLSMVQLTDDALTTTPLQTTTCLGTYFASSYCADNLSPQPTLPQSCPNEFPPKVITPAAVSNLLSNPNLTKSPGHYGIHLSILKMRAPVISQTLTTLILLT